MSKKDDKVTEELEKIDEEIENLEKTQEDKDKDSVIENLKNELEETSKKADEYFEHLKRSMAEFDNYKKRTLKEKEGLYKSITSDILCDILPVVDNFEQALNAETKDDNLRNGLLMIYNQLNDVLKKFGLQEIETKDKTFDPNLHEAVMHIEDENYGEKQIVDVLRKGYKLGDKVIRHSLVKVAN